MTVRRDQSYFKIGQLNNRFTVHFSGPSGDRVRFRLAATTIEAAVLEGQRRHAEYWDTIEKKEAKTVQFIWDSYQRHLGERSSARRMKSEGISILQHFGPYRPEEITEEMVHEYMLSRRHLKTGKPVSDETLWTELGRLRDAISYGARKRWIKPEEVPYIPRPSKPNPRDRWLTDDEIVALLEQCKDVPHLFLAVHLMLATAARVTAALELTWDRVNFDSEVIDLRLPRALPMKRRAAVPMTITIKHLLIEAHKDRVGIYVIEWEGKPIKSIKKSFNSAANRAGLKGVTPHVLRHTAAVRMAAAGCSMERIAAYLGHASPDITRKVYAKFAPDHLKDEARAADLSDLYAPKSKKKKKK